jgi:hypothetical protein
MKASIVSLVCLVLVLTAISVGAQSDSLTGTWAGDWGPTPTHRNAVTVELTWDGTNLTGIVNPGPDAIELAAASFDAATGMVNMEADATGFRGAVHFMIEGKLEGSEMVGSWNHDNTAGDFKITIQ